MSMNKKIRKDCLNCGLETARFGYKYCSNKCQTDFQYKSYIILWLSGGIVGLQRLGVVSRHIKRYLREKYSDKCCLCGWAILNRKTGIVPLVADHIDGDWKNNVESNLRLICPNCDAISETYAGSNIGKGRSERKLSKRVIEARKLSDQSISS